MDLTSYIASMSVSMAQANVAQSVSAAMLSKSIDSIEQSGAEVVDLINSADIPPAGVTGHLLNIKASFLKTADLSAVFLFPS